MKFFHRLFTAVTGLLILSNTVFAEEQKSVEIYDSAKSSIKYSEPLEEHEELLFADTLPIHFGAHVFFMSHWLDEGTNPSPDGMNIHQFYSANIPVFDIVTFEYEYFQADYNKSTPHTLERDHSVSATFKYKLLEIKPLWTYIDIPEDKDSGEIGLTLSMDIFLNPTFTANYDYRQEKGYYCEWGLSHNFDLNALGTITPSIAMGLNSHKGTGSTFLTHIDWGLGYSYPIWDYITIVGFIHITKGLKTNDGYEDITPWGGFGIDFEL